MKGAYFIAAHVYYWGGTGFDNYDAEIWSDSEPRKILSD